MTAATESVEIRDVPERHRYELLVDGSLAGVLQYHIDAERITLVHTQVMAEWDGRGLGSRLAAHALDDARTRGLPIVVQCPFVRAYVRRHPEYGEFIRC